MSNQNICPTCQTDLDWQDGFYHCETCKVTYKKQAFCPDCGEQLEKLQACGAASYFCNGSQCNELKSKSRARIEFEKVGEAG